MSGTTGTQIDGMPIANIVLAEIINESTGGSLLFDTAETADCKPDLSQGKEDILRVKNRIIAMNRTEDICIGYNIKLKNNTFTPEVMCLVDGGTMSSLGYEGPEVGIVTERQPFTLNLYSEEKDYDSSTISYVKFTFKHNKGKPVDFKFEDGKFYVPEFESHSRPKKGEKPVYVGYVNALPTPGTTPSTNPTVPSPPAPTSPDSSTKTPGVSIGTDCKIVWIFSSAVNDVDVTTTNFKVFNKSTGAVVSGNVTMDSTKTIITFVPTSIASGVTYTAQVVAIRSAGSSTPDTKPVSVDFTTA